MKKGSTAAAKQSRNISQPKLTIGLDLGDRHSWYCMLDPAGRIQLEQRVRTTAKALQEVFSAMPRSRIALETGTHSPWISRLLSELGHEVIVAHARKVHQQFNVSSTPSKFNTHFNTHAHSSACLLLDYGALRGVSSLLRRYRSKEVSMH